MPRGNRTKEILNSKAMCRSIEVFQPRQVSYEVTSDGVVATFEPLKYQDLRLQLSPIEDGIIRKFPIIYRSNNAPWDLGNLYLMWKFSTASISSDPSIETIISIAHHLTQYLRWIEHESIENPHFHELYFPERARLRVTYRYNRYLKKQTGITLSLSTAKSRMNAVTNFYKGLIEGELVDVEKFKNSPYEKHIVGIPVTSSAGLEYIRNVSTTNLRIKGKQRDYNDGLIKDEGRLRPLTDQEQDLIHKELIAYGNYEFLLTCWTSLFTGARIQTVCTLTVESIKNSINSKIINGEVLIKVGKGTDIDVKGEEKNNVSYRLHVPISLYGLLLQYANSEQSKERRLKSHYGDIDQNYLFLSEKGTPFYTSRKEIKDRQNPVYSNRISAIDRVDFPIARGNSVRNKIASVCKRIKSKNPSFSKFQFHDLRATYAMNFVNDNLKEDIGTDAIAHELKARMGHANIFTSMRYVKYREDMKLVEKVSLAHSDRLNTLIEQINSLGVSVSE